MRLGRRPRGVFVSTAVLTVVLTALLPSSATPAVRPPVSTFSDATFGKVLSRRDKQVLYYWTVEKKAGGKVKCVGSCAVAWPPLIVKSRTAVPPRIAAISGVFGTVRRPDGRLQVTRNGLALYTYAHERPRQVLCNDVNGWFVVRVR
jgi:predicted lipoprotein with Yx(FWY)xxD motif